jgi:hypothetical protein
MVKQTTDCFTLFISLTTILYCFVQRFSTSVPPEFKINFPESIAEEQKISRFIKFRQTIAVYSEIETNPKNTSVEDIPGM